MYRELYMNMRHSGANRTLQLIGKGFYSPKMEEEVHVFL